MRIEERSEGWGEEEEEGGEERGGNEAGGAEVGNGNEGGGGKAKALTPN